VSREAAVMRRLGSQLWQAQTSRSHDATSLRRVLHMIGLKRSTARVAGRTPTNSDMAHNTWSPPLSI
jgi:hypothetical protein